MSQKPRDPRVVELLNTYYKKPVTQKLREKYLMPSILDVIQKDRSETVHSNFLKWIFDLQLSNRIEGFNIISSLLQVANQRALEQNKEKYFPHELAKAAFGNSNSIQLSKEVEREYPCPGVYYNGGKNENFGIVDIVITGTFSQGNEITPFKIIIENKVDTTEHDFQTWKYYTFFEGKKDDTDAPQEIDIKNKQYNSPDGEKRVYLFLTPESNPANATCACNRFVKINYQDIMDSCIMPLLQNSRLDFRYRLFLEEYSRALSLPYINNIGKTIIMCLNQKDADLLKEFWEANQKLITLSLQALKQYTQDDEGINATLDAIKNVQSSRKNFSITHLKTSDTRQSNQSNLMYDLMSMYIKHKVMNGNGAEIISRYNVKDIGKVFLEKGETTTGYSKESLTFADGKEVRVTTQVQRREDKLKKIKKIAEQDGFLIE